MYPRPRRFCRRRRLALLVRGVQLAGFAAVARGERAPVNPREEIWDELRRTGHRVDPADFILPHGALLTEQAVARREERLQATETWSNSASGRVDPNPENGRD